MPWRWLWTDLTAASTRAALAAVTAARITDAHTQLQRAQAAESASAAALRASTALQDRLQDPALQAVRDAVTSSCGTCRPLQCQMPISTRGAESSGKQTVSSPSSSAKPPRAPAAREKRVTRQDLQPQVQWCTQAARAVLSSLRDAAGRCRLLVSFAAGYSSRWRQASSSSQGCVEAAVPQAQSSRRSARAAAQGTTRQGFYFSPPGSPPEDAKACTLGPADHGGARCCMP